MPRLPKLTLRCDSSVVDAVKAEMTPCVMLAVLMGLIDSPTKAIAKASVICIGLSLPNGTFVMSSELISTGGIERSPPSSRTVSMYIYIAENLAEIIRLGCIDTFLKLMTPANPSADAVMYALSLIADETDAIFPKEITISTSLKMLETLRGAAKRSKNASAMGFLFAALAKSPVFHSAMCSEHNLSILSKLLVGGSQEVLCSSAYALGVVAMYAAQDSVKELLFRVDAPPNLLKLLTTSGSSEKVIRLAIFALACTLHEGLVLSPESGRAVYPELITVAFESSPLRISMLALCDALLASPALVDLIYDHAIMQYFTGSTYAFKLLACLSLDARIRAKCGNALCIQRMLGYTRAASSGFLATCLTFFIECTNVNSSHEFFEDPEPRLQAVISESRAFCLCLEQQATTTTTDAFLPIFVELFTAHAPDQLFGLAVLFSNFVRNSSSMKAALSTKSVVDSVLITVTRLNNAVLHDQVLRFLDDLTQQKNDAALQILFENDPDRVANLLHAPQHPHIQLVAATLLRRMFKRLNAHEVPSTAAKRHLVKLMSSASANLKTREVAIAACRVWGNLFLYDDKRAGFAKITNAVEVLLILLSRCTADDCAEPLPEKEKRKTTLKHLHVAMRSVYRTCLSDEVKKTVVSAPHFLCIVDLFAHSDERIAHLAITTMAEIARSSVGLRKHVTVATVLTTVNAILRDRDQGSQANSSVFITAKLDCLDLLSALAKKEPGIQHLLVEYKLLDAVVLLLHSPLTTLDWRLLRQCLETLAWMASGDESTVRRLIATPKMVDLALRHVDSSREQVTTASLHLLQRLSGEQDVKEIVKSANGPAVIMRALSNCSSDPETRTRACSLIRNLVSPQHEANRKQFQRLGANSYLVALVTLSSSALKLRIKGLYAISAMVEGVSAIAKASKQEVVECEDSLNLVRLVKVTDDRRLCAAWCFTLAMLAHGSSLNQKKLVDATGIIELLIKFVVTRDHAPLRVFAAQLLAYLASLPENRPVIMKEGSDELLLAIIDALQATELHELQRFTALFVANLATRNDDNKVRIGASGAIASLIDRLSSKQLNVLENVLHAIMKLGSHAGNKVKFGSKVGFEKLLALVHHDELTIRKSAVSTIAVLIEGNDVNKKFLLQCEASVVTELCALMKSTNGKVIESAMLILGELSLLPDQTLEISKYIDILVIVRMMEHVNVKIRRAALTTVMNLTKESFNKLRFGIRECIDALLLSLKSDDLIIVELAISCLANLSFTSANASQIAQTNSALTVLLKLAAASTTSKDYLTWKEARFLRLDKHNANALSSPERSPQKEAVSVVPQSASVVFDKVDEKRDGDEIDEADWSEGGDELSVYSYCGFEGQSEEVLDFSSFPSRQTSVLEQTLLILSNCAEEFHERKLVEKVAIKVICQALHHPSELVKRCACFILGFWCKKDVVNQEIATSTAILPVLIQLLNSPNLNIVEAAMYALCKLAYYGDNHAKMLSLDLLNTLVQGILRRPGNLTHDGLLDRSLRLLGTLVTFPKVRQVVKSEEIISDILTNLLQIHKDALAKNISRLVLVMLEEESLRFFLPKKTVMLLRAIFTDASTSTKTVRNILRIFKVIALVEEHKITIALEDSGEALGKMVHELHVVAEMEENLMRIPASAPNADTILHLLAGMSSTKRIAAILFDKKVYAVLPLYLVPFEPLHTEEPDGSLPVNTTTEQIKHLEMNVNAVVIVKHLCTSQQEEVAVTTFSSLEFTQFMLNLLRNAMELADYKLTKLSFECLVILDKLGSTNNNSSSHDQQVLFQEAAVDVFAFYLELWLRVLADDNRLLSFEDEQAKKPGFLKCDALSSIEPLEFIPPLAQILLSLTTHQENCAMQVYKGCMMLILQAMSVASLSNDLRLCFAKTIASLSELPVAKEFFDHEDHVSPLFRFMFAHEANAELLLYSLQSFSSIMVRSPASRHHILSHASALSFLLGCLADAKSDSQDSKVYFAILSLECLSMEKEIALRLALLGELSLVPKLLLLPMDSISRETQYFAAKMIGYMALYGHADKLKLQEPMVARILSFAAFEGDELVTASSIKLALSSLAQLAKSTLSPQICKWIVKDPARLDVLIKCGLMPPKSLGITSVVVGYTLSILIQIVDVDEVVSALVAKRICTPLSLLLEAMEQDLRLSALKILSLLLPRYGANELTSASIEDGIERKEDWGAVLRHLVEWMEVYARDLVVCSIASLEDAYASLSFISSLSSVVASEFQGGIMRTGIAEIVANTMTHFDSKTREVVQPDGAVLATQELHERILLYALKVCYNLMSFSSVYSDRFVQLGAPMTMENVLHLQSHELHLETLKSMNHLANLSADKHLQFASFRCVTRLKQLAQRETTSLVITAKVTPLLALMAKKLPSLPGLCCLDGIDVISNVVLKNWCSQPQWSDPQLRITEDGCEMLLAMFSSDENVFALYDQTRVITKLFEIVAKHGAPELPLRVLVKISDYMPSHPRFMSLLPALCLLLLGDSTQLSTTSHNLILSILFNIFCREVADKELFTQALAIGESAVLPQVLPLSRWTHVLNSSSVEIVLKLLFAYMSGDHKYRTLFNDGANIPSLLELVGAEAVEVAVAAANLLLCASEEREVQISITVEDGIGSLVRTLQRTSHWTLQCLILTILRNMSPDSEIQVLILNDNGVARLIEFVKERKGVLFSTDERLALSCAILRQISHTSSATSQLVAAHGHTSLVELNTLQLASKQVDEDERVTTVEILSKLTKTGCVVHQLIDAKLHELFLKYVLPTSRSATGADSHTSCAKLAFAGLRSLCQENQEVRCTLGSKEELIPLLEANLSLVQTDTETTTTTTDSLALLQFLSKTKEGRKNIFTKTSRVFIETLCALVCKASLSSSANSNTKVSSVNKTLTTSPIAIMGVKLIANLLTDISQERFQVSWQYDKLLTLSPLLEVLLANHQQPKLQLKALLVLSGSFLGASFYFQLSPQMLSDLLNILLISASKQHCKFAEDIVVHAFQDLERVRASIGGNQILEQLLIVVTQKTTSVERRALGSALTEALYVSIAHKFVVNQRFLSKILSLLTSSAVSAGGGEDSVVASSEEDQPLVRALCIYLSFVFKSSEPAVALQHNIREVLRSEVNATAFEAITEQVFALHLQGCKQISPEVKSALDPSSVVSFSKHLLLWNLFAECLSPPVQHVQRILNHVKLSQWLCCVSDFFSAFRDWESKQRSRSAASMRESTSDNNSSTDDDALLTETPERPTITQASSVSQDDAILATFKVASVLTRLTTAGTDEEDTTSESTTLSNRKQTVGTWCLETLWDKADSLDKHCTVVEAALTALLDIRDGWGENCLLAGCKSYSRMGVLLVKLLPIFHSPYRALNQSRHLLLQLLLTLVSTGSFIDELKASDIQSAIENNELIAAVDKALPITILSLLGYNADLNSEFALALERCLGAGDASMRKENLAYLVNFLQLYAITDENLQQRAITVFMKELVANACATEGNDEEELSSAITRSCVVGLVKISGVRKFVDLYLQEWNLNALLGVAFAWKKGDQANDFQERASLMAVEIGQLLEIATRICSWLGSPISSTTGSIDEQNVVNALTLVQTLSRQELPLVEQVIGLLSWLVHDAECFQYICLHAPLLNAFLLSILELGDDAVGLFLGLLEQCIHNTPRIDYLNELLIATLAFVYRNAAKLSRPSFVMIRDKLLLYILLIMKRLGEEGLSGSEVYEHAIQLILANIRAMDELEARISWNLLGMLTEFDPAIVTIFNFDGIQMLLREFCVVTPPQQQPSRTASRSSLSMMTPASSYQFRMEALKCLSKSARTHDEVLFKIGETTNIGAILFTVLANAATETTGSQREVVMPAANIGKSQEHASHLIARISSQEYLRASLLSQDHVSILIESMESVHLKVVLHSLEALANLCEFAMCLDALVRHATVPVLGQILFSPLAEGETQKKTEEFVLGILGSMCSKSKLICRRVVSSNLVPKLNLYLSSSRTSVHHNATWVINCLSKDVELVPKLRDHGVLETLCNKLLDYDPRKTQSKALGALANLVALSRVSIVTSNEVLARAIVGVTIESINRNIPNAQAQHTIAKGLSVFEAIAVQDYEAKAMLYEDNAIQITSALLGAPDAEVRLKALHVTTKWVEENHEVEQIRELFSDAILLNLVRAISEEMGEMLLVALALLNTLLSDEFLKEKLTSMTYEVLLRLVVTHTSQSVTTAQSRVLVESLKALAAMTKLGKVSVSTSSEIVNSVEPLILLLQTSPSDSIRIDSLYLLVNFASAIELRGSMLRCGMLQALVAMLGTAVQLRDEKVVQLSLLGMALLTSIDFSDCVGDLAGVTVETLVGLLSSRNPNIQANTVWVLSNISSEGESVVYHVLCVRPCAWSDQHLTHLAGSLTLFHPTDCIESLRSAIIALGGATTLQAILNETMSSADFVSAPSTRPTSSSLRIREYAPKAIKSLGFAPLTGGGGGGEGANRS